MLTVAKVTAGQAGGYAEYLEGRSKPSALGDYYLKDGDRVEAPGRWAAGAKAVGCESHRPVSPEELRALLAVRRPDSGLPLRPVGANKLAVAAIDASFSAPKSVSAVWALGDLQLRELIEQAHERAIDRALDYSLDQVAMIRERMSRDHVVHVQAASLVATSWRHTTARAVQDQPPDPQLHSHVLLHAAVRWDGKLMAIDSRAWLMHRRELGAAYRTELARELAALGFAIERGTGRGGRYFEIEGIPNELINRWSSRHQQVQGAIEARLDDKRAALEALIAGGPNGTQARCERKLLTLSPREDRYLTSATRAPKHTLSTPDELDRHWAYTAREAGFDRAAIGRLRQYLPPPAAASAQELIDRLTEFDATFTDREARAAALEASTGTSVRRSLPVLEQLKSSGDLLALADGSNTTTRHRRLEQHTISTARSLAAARAGAIPRKLVERQLRKLDGHVRRNGGRLTGEQRIAIQRACSDRRIVMIEGQAGSGKSTVLAAIARAHQAAGQRIIVTSTAGLAAHRLAHELQQAGVETASYSTAALARGIEDQRVALLPTATVIHDEAALASTLEQHQLLSAVEAAGARLIEVGDPRQSQSVGAGGLWPHLEQTARRQQAHIQLSTNVRALDAADRRDQALFRDGHHEHAIRGYHARERVHLRDLQRQTEDLALEAAQADRQAGKNTILIAQASNEHLDELNARAQAIRIQHGELGRNGLAIGGRPYELHAGDDIQVRRTISHPAAGRLRNGTTAHISDIDSEHELITLRLDNGQHLTLDRDHTDAADLRLAYVQHPVPAQGQTTDTTYLIVAEHATQEGTYVALTRARQQTHIYTSHEQLELDENENTLAALAEHLGRREPQVPSIRTPLAHEAAIDREHTREDSLSEAERETGRWIAALGPQLLTDSNRSARDGAGTAVECCRARYHYKPPEHAAPARAVPPAGKFLERNERRQTAELVQEALGEVDRRWEHGLGIDESIGDDAALAPEHQDAVRNDGWEP